MFNELRATGSAATGVGGSKWLTEPLRTANSFCDAMLAAGGVALPAQQAEHMKMSLVARALLCGRWAVSGYPTVVMGHRTAAQLMATSIRPEDAAEFVRAPWPAFMIRLPTPLLTVEDEGRQLDATLLLATMVDGVLTNAPTGAGNCWWYMLIAPEQTNSNHPAPLVGLLSGASLWGYNTATTKLAGRDIPDDPTCNVRWDMAELVGSDERSEDLARKLIIGTCLHLSGDPRERALRQREGLTVVKRQSKQRDGDELPTFEQYELRSAIKINLHHAMHEYVRHGGSAPKVQSLVAGHWKRVAFGEGRAQRRLQLIEPYWRGDLDAPIAARSGN